MAVTCQKTLDSGKTLFQISVNTCHICMGSKQIPQERYRTMPSDKDLGTELQCRLKVKEDIS